MLLALAVAQVVAAVAQLAVVQIGLLGPFASQFGYAGNGLALLLALLDFLQHDLGHEGVLVQIVVHLGLDEVAYIFVHRRSGGLLLLWHGWPHVVTAQLGLGLALEHRLFHVDGNGRYDAVAYVCVLLVLVEKLLDGASQVLLQGRLVRTALGGVLAVDEGVVLLAILIGVGKGNLNIFALEVDDVVEPFAGHVILQQILQTMA